MLKKENPQVFTLIRNRPLIGGLHKEKRLYSLRNQPFSSWTSLGLNQGPPDYENDKMIFCDNQRF